ncbi:hypothetical protein Q5H92_18300 [Hymenobacter sp. M29]|uniref:DUF4352 domain-containing protein n=1 Tax=Hymenobacter mellowenesis TaxID=3063995 RepID=A0ABT9AEP1_9BACT|nr:hypothetical protein [Hymenobacter sp. M29]MDO7848325.1 hypothetical protein [Hymenobacter sp. M29]
MKSLFLLITVLLALISKAAGQTAVPAPADLADLIVTAEIIGYAPNASPHLKEEHPRIVLYAQMTIRNTTNHVRDIFMMSCDWPSFWIAKGPRGLFHAAMQPRCDKNAPTVVSIPVGEAAIFRCPLLLISGDAGEAQKQDSTHFFKLGFLDFGPNFEDFSYASVRLGYEDDGRRSKKSKKRNTTKKARPPKVYWSDLVSNRINLLKAKEINGDSRYFSYYVTRCIAEASIALRPGRTFVLSANARGRNLPARFGC